MSLLVAMRNEANHIERCLESILTQDYPNIEVWVLDGQSTDGSWQIVERMIRGRTNCFLVSNPGITQSMGWNLGIERASGDIIGIVSAHAELAQDYVSKAVETLQRTQADLVGGPMRAFGTGPVGRAVALATSTPFGVGGAKFHYASREGVVDTVYMGLCWKEMYLRIGPFDPEMVRNQDDELSYRLLERGGRIVCNPAIQSRYYNRATLGSLWRQYYQYGCWKVRVIQKHPRQARLRHCIPSMFVISLLASAAWGSFSPVGSRLVAIVGVPYLLANLAASVWAVRKGLWRELPLLPVVYMILHLSYGVGFLVGLVRFRRYWRRNVNG